MFRAGDGKKIELLVQPDKARSVSSAEFPPFHTEFDPKNPTVVWLSRPLTPEERCRLDIDDPLGEVVNIGKERNDHHLAWQFLSDDERAVAIIDDMLSGCHDDVIAANLAVREIAVKDFKQEHGITDKALSEHLSDAKDSAKKNQGKITPNALASEIWKLLKPKD